MNIRRMFYRPRACCSFAVITYAFVLGVTFTLIQTASEIFIDSFRHGKQDLNGNGAGNTADQSPQLAQIIRRSILNYGPRFQVLPSLFSKYDENADDYSTPKTATHILIVTNRRSGSSFLGQLFNQNKNIFFHFEPLKSIEQTVPRQFFPGNSTEMISDIFKCRFPPKHLLLNFYSRNYLHRMSSRVLSSSPLCEPEETSAKRPTCKALKSTTTRSECTKYKQFAIKTIRFAKLQDIEPLARDPSLNLKIIHLVRDPRGTFISRAKSEKKPMDMTADELNNVRYLCLRMQQNLEFVTNVPTPDWLKGIYKIVRYEDMARKPAETAQDIYDFAGLGRLPRNVVQWLRNNTKTSRGDSYAVTRNSSATWQEWRYSIPFETSVGIQDVCRDVLRLLGYREVPMQYLLRDAREDLLKPLPSIWNSLHRPKDIS
ncbi:carbohydrate sulfotransferase 1-like [Anneissia japonica]|uniref:carbohydrate sulfotransferase 1-like n=1 Tax=Anneissia japonica TaxID=1529436 RepID=UPI001425AC55|nr:carbohydrate sulfotransferase 1-like [Anneissia japonica]XP_033124780.1 carbohydrate sulfotransferase 1-like [Anneissia japonica]XP_033124781.1 carbohydrate sulfotransferase 1-like [Anneissia japonica]